MRFCIVAAYFLASIMALALACTVYAHDLPSRASTILDWQTSQNDKVVTTFLPNYLAVNFIGGGGKVVDFEGKRCLRGSHFAFSVSNDYAYNIDEDLTLTVEFGSLNDEQSKTYVVVYDKNGGGDGVVSGDISNKTALPFETQSIQLANARFADRGDLSTDFVIAGGKISWMGVVTKPITICDLRLSRQANPSSDSLGPQPSTRANAASQEQQMTQLKLRIVDEYGDESAVRMGIYDHNNRLVLPSNSALAVRKFDQINNVFLLAEKTPWPAQNRYFYYAQGEYSVSLPAGDYTLVATKGLEYQFVNRRITVNPNQVNDVLISMLPWRSLRKEGWYSGDVHIHSVRSNVRIEQNDNIAL